MNAHLPATLPDLDKIEEGFNRSIELFEDAFAKIAEADAAIKRAFEAVAQVTPGATFHDQSDASELKAFYKAVRLPDRKRYLHTARKIMNLRCWHYTVDRCGLQQLMDHQAKKELDAQLRYSPDRVNRDGELITEDEAAKGPPPFSAENARATLTKFAADSNTIWRRGIANVFSALDRRFRSHDGFKVGSRIILNYFIGSSGHVLDYGDAAERFRDIERTFQILDGRDPRHARSDFLYQIKEERAPLRWNPGQSEHENDYFKVRIFKNGNAHLWFTRKDLVELVNKELAAYYGEVIGDGQTKEADPFENKALTPARLFGFYPTPPEIADAIVRQVPWHEGSKRILEPSAGTGNFAYRLAETYAPRGEKPVRHTVDAVEIQPKLAAALRESGKLNRVTEADFMLMPPSPIYDGVVMNPPFDRERDIDHVVHALKFLKEDGWLLAIMSAGVEFRETRKAAAFRKILDERNGWMIDLPRGAFASVGAHVNTVLIGIGMRRPHGIF